MYTFTFTYIYIGETLNVLYNRPTCFYPLYICRHILTKLKNIKNVMYDNLINYIIFHTFLRKLNIIHDCINNCLYLHLIYFLIDFKNSMKYVFNVYPLTHIKFRGTCMFRCLLLMKYAH